MLPVEGTLLEKLRKIEALHAGTTIAAEREAARRSAERIRARLTELRSREQDVDLQYSLPDPWKRKLFVALCRRYGLRPYRSAGQRYSTVMVHAPETFQHRTLWPEFLEQVVREAMDEDVSEAPRSPPQETCSASADLPFIVVPMLNLGAPISPWSWPEAAITKAS
jgi:hypothetical protein